MAPTYRLAFDIGGTFTDFALLDTETGALEIFKCLTTPDDPSRASLHGSRMLLERAGVGAEALTNVIHGTTLVTNALIERKGAKVALLTTEGFRDTLALRTEQRYDIYDLALRFPEPLVPRYLRREIRERTEHTGEIVAEVREADVAAALTRIREEDAKDRRADPGAPELSSVAISFLHSYRNPENERAAADLVRKLWPEADISVSSEVAPEIREYERTSTTVANAYVRPLTREYLRTLATAFAETGYRGRLYLMLSSGGIATVETVSEVPVRLIESGPAGGAIGAAHYGGLCGERDLIAFDMGGTTAKICLIEDGRPAISHQLEVARVHRFKKGSGLPIQFPSVEMLEIGAGGGSVAWIDELGLLKVGPQSAGAAPGPACYGLGGTLPTVTDAALVLGYLDPASFLGGEMTLDRAAAERAIDEHVAGPLGVSRTEAAWGIHQLVVENMAAAAKLHIVERGGDPRSYALLASGGAGPIHAASVARLLGNERILYPLAAGVLSAIGFLVAPVSFEFSRSQPQLLDTTDWDAVGRLVTELEEQGRDVVAEAGVARADVTLERQVSARFAGQINEISVPLPGGELDASCRDEVRTRFLKAYTDLYGHAHDDIPVEVMTWRVVASGRLAEVAVERRGARAFEDPVPQHARPAYWIELESYVDTPVYDRYPLEPGMSVPGPALVEERESTVLVAPGSTAVVDEYRNLVVTRTEAQL
ncbi:hydantoinase/oxoprolinase family protein [Amycolatopsis sp. NPDC005232]|uniref:hydantoinase/oxoprolinase family protein n=1 Tax=Amycolatopsis sp. NPDC005232 TaxID=3157027 RepID=UPI00339E1158